MKTRETNHGTFWVGAYRFTGEHGLSQAIRWAQKVQQYEPAGSVRITNEFGIDLGVVEAVRS